MPVSIRPSRADDSAALQEVERRAGQQFRDVGMPDIADAEPASIEELNEYASAHRGWVAVDDDDRPIGYLIVDTVDSAAHIEQFSVSPDRQGTGVGRALLDQVRTWAAENGYPAITLTTFTDVPWNRPLYEHLGFRVIPEEQIGPELRAVREHEAALGLEPAIRVCMRSRVHE